MTRQGFALLAVLWVIVALASIVGLGVGATRLGQTTSANRLLLTRGHWAAEACSAIVESRWVNHRFTDTATIDLGRGARCGWRVDDPTARLNVNTAPVVILESLAHELGVSRAVVDTLVAHRPYQDTAQVHAALTSDPRLQLFLTVDGPGTINVNAASPEILMAIPGLGPEAAAALAAGRRFGHPIGSLDQLASNAPGERPALFAHYADLAGLLTFAPPQLLLTASGWVGGLGSPSGLHATSEDLAVPLPDRLAVIRRRLW
ncbi:MAG TPA: hypothetical protein VH113_07260 [Gemmatimonadales bacterium]|jgi:type II secretory pathway component PulK|nr:hypothetical protein [Gemmatimonadales bacterium]